MRRRGSNGLSLLEIIVAMAVLTATAVVLAQMINLGARHAERAQQITEAQTIAHNLLSELLAELRPWDASETPQPVDPWSNWDYLLRIEPLGLHDLVAVTVTVMERDEAEGDAPVDVTAADQALVTNPRHYRLTRWTRRDSEPTDELGLPTDE